MRGLRFLTPLLLSLTACSIVDLPDANIDGDPEGSAGASGGAAPLSDEPGDASTAGAGGSASDPGDADPADPCESGPADQDSDGVCDALDRCEGDVDIPPTSVGGSYKCERTIAVSSEHSGFITTQLTYPVPNAPAEEISPQASTENSSAILDITTFRLAGDLFVHCDHAMLSADTRALLDGTVIQMQLRLNLRDGEVSRHDLQVHGADTSTSDPFPAFGVEILADSFYGTQNHLGPVTATESDSSLYVATVHKDQFHSGGYTELRIAPHVAWNVAYFMITYQEYTTSFHGPNSPAKDKVPRLVVIYRPSARP